jgi:hypothetical protein
MMQTDMEGIQFSEDEDRNGPWKVGLLDIEPLDVTARLSIFYWIVDLLGPVLYARF